METLTLSLFAPKLVVPACNNPRNPDEAEIALRYMMMYWLAKAEQHLLKNYPVPELDLSLKGRCAGQAFLQTWRVRFNLQLLSENYDHFMLNVVPHELAHLIAFREFGARIRPHGKEWRWVMEQVLGVAAKTTHQYDVSKSAKQHFVYQCGCMERKHHLTIRRHNKIAQGISYLCKHCRQSLIFAYQQVPERTL